MKLGTVFESIQKNYEILNKKRPHQFEYILLPDVLLPLLYK